MDEALFLLKAGGVVGGGGAGFPTWKKLEGAAGHLIVNGAECEPLLKSDQFLMEHHADALVEGASMLRKICGAQRVTIALKAHYEGPVAALREAIRRADAPIELKLLPSVYPVGDEQVAVYACTGQAIAPLSLPGSVGVCVVSVSTVLNALRALHGAPVTRRLVTVAGAVKRPGLFDVPVGMPVREVIERAGGAACSGARMMLGGPMMGALAPEDGDPVVTKTCGGILVLPPEHALVRRAELPLEHMRSRAKSACIQCRNCTDLCPRFLQGQPLAPHRVMRGFAAGRADPAALLCVECGICEWYACPMNLSPRRVQAALKERLRAEGAQPDRNLLPDQTLMRAARQVPSARLMARLDVTDYDIPVPEHASVLSCDRVRVPLKQHIGAPCEPCVRAGEVVKVGQVIGQVPEGALGAYVHASIDGTVESVAGEIVIRGREQA